MKKKRPGVIAFDVIETLFSLDPIGDRLASAGLTAESVPIFFGRLLRDAFALETSGVFKPFGEVAAATLEVLIANSGKTAERHEIEFVLDAFGELPVHLDVPAAFDLARSLGFRMVTLTNGSAKNTQKLLSRASLAEYIEEIISIDEIRHWKPRREVYLHAAQKMSSSPGSVALVAVHPWDTHGASQAGLVTAWVRRKEKIPFVHDITRRPGGYTRSGH